MNELFNMSQYYVHINDKYTLYWIVWTLYIKSGIQQAIHDIFAFI
jgi:hypothetical protein